MKSSIKAILSYTLVMFMFSMNVAAQANTEIQYMANPGKESINVFEQPKTTDVEFEGLKVRVGGNFALQFQGLSQSNDFGAGDPNTLAELSNNFNLPAANLNFDVQLADGMRMHLRTYLSSKHHPEAWVKGGFIQIDKLDFIQEDFLSDLMQYFRIRVGMDQFNYGDAQFRRSDNAAALVNPFVGNYLMDSFSTEPFMEISYLNEGIIGVIGATNGRLNQSPLPGDDGFVVFGKAGYDTQVNEDLRVRLTGSFYSSSDQGTRDYLYGGDRAGSRYYSVLHTPAMVARGGPANDFSGRFNPGFAYQTAFQINPFVKFQGLEFFGIFEMTSGDNLNRATGAVASTGSFTQLGAEVLYRFGDNEDFYVGGRYNSVNGEFDDSNAATEASVNRINFGGGWFLTDNVVTKLEYVSQSYSGDGFNGTLFQGAEFSGIMIEAVISF